MSKSDPLVLHDSRTPMPRTQSPLRVVHFILDHRIGGPHVYVRSVVEELRDEIQSTVVTTGNGPWTDVALTNLRHRHKLLYPFEIVWNVGRICWRFRRRANRSEVIFDVHGAANIAPIIAAGLLGIPLVWHFHEILPSFLGLARVGKVAASRVPHRFVAVAAKAAEVFGLHDAVVIPSGVDVDFWRRTSVRGRDSTLHLLAVGNLNPLKGFDILLQALKTVRPPWELVIVGAELGTFAEYADDLRRQSEELADLGGQVRFVGWQERVEIRRLLASCDVFVLSSRSEACPIALLEAMAMECPCVATDVGDVGAMLGSGDAGLVVPSESPESLAVALTAMADRDARRLREIGCRARERVVAGYSQDVAAKRHLEIYLQLAGPEGLT